MMSGEKVNRIWGYLEEDTENQLTTKFLELLIQHNYAWNQDDQDKMKINLGRNEKAQFLNDFNQFVNNIVDDYDELQASVALGVIKEIYDNEYNRLQAASNEKEEPKIPWFSLAHQIFPEPPNKDEDGNGSPSMSAAFVHAGSASPAETALAEGVHFTEKGDSSQVCQENKDEDANDSPCLSAAFVHAGSASPVETALAEGVHLTEKEDSSQVCQENKDEDGNGSPSMSAAFVHAGSASPIETALAEGVPFTEKEDSSQVCQEVMALSQKVGHS